VVIPVYDEDHRRRGARPWVMWSIFALNVLLFVLLMFLPSEVTRILNINLGIVPAFVTKSIDAAEFNLLVPSVLTLATYMFVHGSGCTSPET